MIVTFDSMSRSSSETETLGYSCQSRSVRVMITSWTRSSSWYESEHHDIEIPVRHRLDRRAVRRAGSAAGAGGAG